MNARVSHTYHFSTEIARDFLTEALALTEEIDPPSDLREAVFVQSVGLLTSRTTTAEVMQSGGIDLSGIGRGQ